MTPRKPARTVRGTPGDARARREDGDLLMDRASLGDLNDPRSRKVDAAIAVLAGIAYADAICIALLGERSSSGDHSHAVQLLRQADPQAASDLQTLISIKTQAQYGVAALNSDSATRAMRAADRLGQRASEV